MRLRSLGRHRGAGVTGSASNSYVARIGKFPSDNSLVAQGVDGMEDGRFERGDQAEDDADTG